MLTHPATWLWAQTLWLVLALGYNLVGILRIADGGKALIDGAPAKALWGLVPFILVIICGWMEKQTLWFWMSLLLLPGLVYIGVWRHIAAALTPEGLDIYAGQAAWIAAIAINVWGSIALLMGMVSTGMGK